MFAAQSGWHAIIAGPGRGMSRWHDWFDWIGGYPYETATVDEIFAFYHRRGYMLERLAATAGLGCNQFVLRKVVDAWTSRPSIASCLRFSTTVPTSTAQRPDCVRMI